MVSTVVKVLEAMMNSVRAGSSRRRVSARWAASTFDTKCKRGPSWYGAKAAVTMAGPRSEPPMPMLTTSVIWPAARMVSAKVQKARSVAATSGITSAPSVAIGGLGGARSAVCRTARFSVVLILLAGEHGVALGRHAGTLRQLQQQRQRRGGERGFGVVQQQVGLAGREAGEAAGVGGEQATDVAAAGRVPGQFRPDVVHAGAPCATWRRRALIPAWPATATERRPG